VNALLEQRLVAFVRIIADRCYGCPWRGGTRCQRCDSLRATLLLRDYESSSAPPSPVDYSLATRVRRITEALSSAGRPLTSREIDLRGTCSAQLKQWTLKRLQRLGVLRRSPAGGGLYLYALSTKPGRGAS